MRAARAPTVWGCCATLAGRACRANSGEEQQVATHVISLAKNLKHPCRDGCQVLVEAASAPGGATKPAKTAALVAGTEALLFVLPAGFVAA